MNMNFKYCYKDEIHKSYSIPSTLSDLMQDIKSSFKNNKLPSNFSLRYKDNDGDFITISSDVEYNSMLKFDTPNCRTSFKIFIISSRSPSTTDKEGSFEVIDTSHNTSQSGISEFSLTSKECEEPPVPEQNHNISSREDELDNSPSEQDRAPANSPQRSKVLMDSSHSSAWKDEQLSFPDVNEESGSFGEETLNEVYKPVVDKAANEQELMSPSLSAGSDMNVSLGREKMENSLEKIFDRMEPMDYRSVDYKDNVIEENDNGSTGSGENSVVLREIDNFMEKLAEQKEQKKENTTGSSEIEVRPLFNAGRIVPVDLFDRRRQEKIMKRKNQAARVIQRAFRAGLLQRQQLYIRDCHFRRMIDPYTTDTAVVGLTSHIKARLQALIEAQIPRPIELVRQTHITPQEVSFEMRRRIWDLDVTEPVDEEEESNRFYSPEQSVTEKLEESGPHDTSLEGLMCRDPSYQAEVKNCNNYYNYRSSSDRILSLHDDYDSRVETPCLEDLLNQSNTQIEPEDTCLELPVVEANPTKHLNYRVMLGMSSSLLFLGGEEGQGVVYKTVYVENTGTRQWRKCYVKPIGDTEGKTLEFYNVDVGEISLLTLELNGYFEAGRYNSQWKLVHENENGMMEAIGEPFEIEFSIDQENIINTLESLLPRRYAEDYQTEDLISKYLGHDEDQEEEQGEAEVYPESYLDRCNEDEEQEEEEEDDEEEEEGNDEEEEYEDEDEEEDEEEDEYEDEEEEYEEDEEEEYEEEQQQEYNEREQMRFNKYCDYREEILKIREMRKIFPLDSLDELIEFVDTRPQLSVEELLIGYLALKNNSQ